MSNYEQTINLQWAQKFVYDHDTESSALLAYMYKQNIYLLSYSDLDHLKC